MIIIILELIWRQILGNLYKVVGNCAEEYEEELEDSSLLWLNVGRMLPGADFWQRGYKMGFDIWFEHRNFLLGVNLVPDVQEKKAQTIVELHLLITGIIDFHPLGKQEIKKFNDPVKGFGILKCLWIENVLIILR